MASKIVWTKKSKNGFDDIVNYLSKEFTEKEVIDFVQDAFSFLDHLSQFPQLLKSTNKIKNLHRGPINKYTILTYRVKPRKKEIELINIRGSRQKPLG